MIGRLLGWVRGIPGALWRGTVGRLFARPAPRNLPVVVAEPEEPRSVAGITFRASLVVAGVAFAAYLLFLLRQLLVLVFLAIVLAAGLHGVVRFFERFMPRVASVLLTYILLVGAFVIVLALIFPPLVREAVQFSDDVPAIAADLRDGAVSLLDGIAGPGVGEDVVGSLTDGLRDALPQLGSLLTIPLTVAGIVANGIIVLFLSALMLIERDRSRGWLLEFVNERDHEAVLNVARNALLRLGAYVRGQLLVMAIIGVGSGIGMMVLGVPFAVPLAALSFITATIPLAGAFISGGPIILVALTVSPLTGLLMAVWLVVLQQLEGSVITPFVVGRTLNLSAIAVLLGVVAGTTLAGIIGGIIAIPLVAVADVVLRDVVFPLRRRAEARRRGLPEEAPAL